MIKAILMDLDGVAVEAREWHYEALNRALRKIANTEIDRDEHLNTFNGLPTKEKLELLIKQKRIKHEDVKKIWEEKQNCTKAIIREMAKYDNEKKDLHEYTKSIGIKTCCVTNSIRETAELMLMCTGQLNYMEFVISNQDISKPKPHPEGYIKGMVKLQSLPEESIIVEDSPVGLKAANATGARVWKVNDCADVTLTNFKQFLDTIS